MLYFGSLMITLVMVAATAIVGRRIAELLPPTLIPIARFTFAPLFGIAAVLLVAAPLGWLLPFSRATTALPMVIAVAICLWFERDRRTLVADLLPVVGLAVITSSTVLFPLLRYDTYNPFNDTFTYLVHSQWLQQHAFSEPAVNSGLYPALTQVTMYQTGAHRMGASFFLAFVQAAFGLKWSYYAYPATAALALTAGSLAVGGVVRMIRPCGRLLVLLIAAATGTMLNGFAYGSFYGFLPQTIGLGMAVGALGLFGALVTAHQEPMPISRVARQTIPAALLFAGLAYAYHEVLPFVAVGILLYLAALLLLERPMLPRVLLGLAILTGESLLAVNYEAIRILQNFLETMLSIGGGAAVVGWPVRWSIPDFIAHSFGFKSPLDDVWLFGHPRGTELMCALFMVVVAIGVTALLKRRQHLPIIGMVLGVVAVFVLAFLHFRYDVAAVWPDDVGHSFLQFKISKWVSPFISVLGGATFAWLAYSEDGKTRRSGWIAESAIAGAVVLAVGWNYVSAHLVTNQILNETGYSRSSFNAFLDLRQLVANLPSDHPIYLSFGADHHKLRQMIAYVLYDRPVASTYLDDAYLSNTIPPKDREMPRSVADWLLTIATHQERDAMTMPVIGNMVLKTTATSQFTLDQVDGSYGLEQSEKDSWYWTAGRIQYHYKVDGKPGNTSQIRLRFGHLGSPRHLHVTITGADSKILASYGFEIGPGRGNHVSEPFSVAPGPLSVLIESDGEAKRISATDPRVVAFLIQNIEFEEDHR
jgi:hypothetical protein